MDIIKNETYEIIKISGGPLLTNCYLISDIYNKNTAIVDLAFCNDQLLELLERHALKLKFILLTHGHFDHIMGLKDIFKILKQTCPVLINEFDAELLPDSFKNASNLMDFDVSINLSNLQTFKDGDIFQLSNNLEFKAMSTPGHTKGSCSFILNNEIMFSGDTLFKNSVGRTDLFSGDAETALQSFKKIKFLNPKLKVLPGHGQATTLEQELKSNPAFQ